MNIDIMSAQRPLIIAIDGHSSCGKSTFARAIARRLGYVYVDTGAMYRAVTLLGLRSGALGADRWDRELLIQMLEQIELEFRLDASTGENLLWMNGACVEKEIRSLEVSGWVSEVSAVPEVRHHMVRLQQWMGRQGGLVMDGRDIGTTVFPAADIKIFMTASVGVRARRRLLELQQKGVPATLDEVRANIDKRDQIDQGRKESPLRRADDAVLLDNSHMTPQQQMVWFVQLMGQKGFPVPGE
jgi:cytidylate kinase